MKLEAAAGLRHLCTKDTPSLNISFPYAKAGRTRSSLLTCFYSLHAPTPSEWFCAVKEKCSEGRGPLGLDLSGSTWFSWQRQNGGKSPAWWVGWATHTHTDIHVSETHYIHLHNHDSMNCHLFITDKKKKKKVYSCFNILAVLICNIWSFFFKGWLWNEKHATLWMLYVKRCRFSGSFRYLHPKEIHFSQLKNFVEAKLLCF